MNEAQWNYGIPPNEIPLKVEHNKQIITVEAFYGRDGNRPHWRDAAGNCWSPDTFKRWQFATEPCIDCGSPHALSNGRCGPCLAPGGFLYRCGMFRDCVLSFRQVDTLAKTLEMSPLVVGPLWDLRVGTRRVLREMRTAPPNKTIDFDSEGQ